MKLGLKIATLIFFVSGIVFFVGYQSGYFFPNQGRVDTLPIESKNGNSVRIEKDGSIEDVPEDSLNKWLGSDSVKEFGKGVEFVAVPEQEIAEPTDEEALRMYSSKSLVIQRRIEYPKPYFRTIQQLIFKQEKQKKRILPSSKSGPVDVDLDLIFPKYGRPEMTTPTQWPSLIDTLK